MTTTRIGTPYFVSLAAARRYYRPYGFNAAGVNAKLAEGEIFIGKPPMQPGDTLGIIDNGTRYEITRPDAAPTPADCEIIGYDAAAGYVIQWDAAGDTTGTPGPYVSGETPEQYGLDNMTPAEIDRLKRDGWKPAEPSAMAKVRAEAARAMGLAGSMGKP